MVVYGAGSGHDLIPHLGCGACDLSFESSHAATGTAYLAESFGELDDSDLPEKL